MPAEPPLLISAIVVSYNTRAMTLECLEALSADLAGIPSEIWVVDNASTDDSVTAIRERYPNVRVIPNEKNAGFGAANNQAMKQATGDFLLLLNSDAFPKPGATRALVDHLQRHPDLAVAGPRLLNTDGTLQRSCYRFPSPAHAWRDNLWITALFPASPLLGDYRTWPHDRDRDVDWLIGACMLVRRSAYEKVGGFDERFFMYAEESDWQKRFRNAGYRIAFTPSAEVSHRGGASGASERARINRHFFESLDAYQLKHHGLLGLISLRLAMIVGCLLRGTLWVLVLPLFPKRRAAALAKTRLHWWLVFRQLFDWRVAIGRY
jgi:GT2 family glycosyltransferase